MMRTAEDLLQELSALDESYRIEAKQARQIDRSVMETICAFANEPGLGGGYLLLGVSRTDTLNASAHLRRLRDLELLEMKGGGSRTYYVSGARFLASQLAPVPAVAPNATNSHQLGQDSHQPEGNSHHLLATIPPELAERIPSAGSKPRRDVMRAMIVDLCRWRALSARELTTILHGREHKPFVRDYLTPMVTEGVLAYTIPEMENHPDQRYTVLVEAADGALADRTTP